MTTEHHIHIDLPATWATFTRQAISQALTTSPLSFDGEQVMALKEVDGLLGHAVLNSLDPRWSLVRGTEGDFTERYADTVTDDQVEAINSGQKFRVIRDEWDNDNNVRTVHEVELIG